MPGTILVRSIEHAIARFTAIQDAEIKPHLVPTTMRLISSDLELIKVGLRQLVRRDPDTPHIKSSLKLIDENQTSLTILLYLMDSNPDNRHVPGLFIDIGATLGGLKGYLLEIDERMKQRKYEQSRIYRLNHERMVSQIRIPTEKITLNMTYQVKAAIDHLNDLYEPETRHDFVPEGIEFINSIID